MSLPILCIGMSDSSAGTGIQADIKTIQAFGEYAATVVTSVCVQNTMEIVDLHIIPDHIVASQIKAVMDDFHPKVIKLGMLANENIINIVGDVLEKLKDDGIKLIVDPVMLCRMGNILIDKPARDAIKRSLLIYADIITPNVREAEELTGLQIRDLETMKHAAEMLMTLGARAVVITGGSLPTDKIYNVYCDDYGVEVFEHPRYETRATHGAGTTLSSAIAANIAKGMSIKDSFAIAQDYVMKSIRGAKKIGLGFGPLNHAVAD